MLKESTNFSLMDLTADEYEGYTTSFDFCWEAVEENRAEWKEAGEKNEYAHDDIFEAWDMYEAGDLEFGNDDSEDEIVIDHFKVLKKSQKTPKALRSKRRKRNMDFAQKSLDAYWKDQYEYYSWKVHIGRMPLEDFIEAQFLKKGLKNFVKRSYWAGSKENKAKKRYGPKIATTSSKWSTRTGYRRWTSRHRLEERLACQKAKYDIHMDTSYLKSYYH